MLKNSLFFLQVAQKGPEHKAPETPRNEAIPPMAGLMGLFCSPHIAAYTRLSGRYPVSATCYPPLDLKEIHGPDPYLKRSTQVCNHRINDHDASIYPEKHQNRQKLQNNLLTLENNDLYNKSILRKEPKNVRTTYRHKRHQTKRLGPWCNRQLISRPNCELDSSR